jgi:hypothetical protein
MVTVVPEESKPDKFLWRVDFVLHPFEVTNLTTDSDFFVHVEATSLGAAYEVAREWEQGRQKGSPYTIVAVRFVDWVVLQGD